MLEHLVMAKTNDAGSSAADPEDVRSRYTVL